MHTKNQIINIFCLSNQEIPTSFNNFSASECSTGNWYFFFICMIGFYYWYFTSVFSTGSSRENYTILLTDRNLNHVHHFLILQKEETQIYTDTYFDFLKKKWKKDPPQKMFNFMDLLPHPKGPTLEMHDWRIKHFVIPTSDMVWTGT